MAYLQVSNNFKHNHQMKKKIMNSILRRAGKRLKYEEKTFKSNLPNTKERRSRRYLNLFYIRI